jgi:2-methylisocitrate lyase-like PEP mutase family enzyme
VSTDLATAAADLRARHQPGHPLILPNVWDPPSAIAVQKAGFPVVATSSAAMLEAIGQRDGGSAPPEEVFAAIARIAAAVEVPVTADIEDGYDLSPAELADRLLAAGAVGCNLEDSDHRHFGSLVDPDVQASRIAELRAAGQARGVDLVINARIDTYLGRSGDPASRLDETVRRAVSYRAAGADCVYPILAPEAQIAAVVAQTAAAVNGLAAAEVVAVTRLAGLGVARISMGPYLAHAARKFVTGLLDDLRPAAST